MKKHGPYKEAGVERDGMEHPQAKSTEDIATSRGLYKQSLLFISHYARIAPSERRNNARILMKKQEAPWGKNKEPLPGVCHGGAL